MVNKSFPNHREDIERLKRDNSIMRNFISSLYQKGAISEQEYHNIISIVRPKSEILLKHFRNSLQRRFGIKINLTQAKMINSMLLDLPVHHISPTTLSPVKCIKIEGFTVFVMMTMDFQNNMVATTVYTKKMMNEAMESRNMDCDIPEIDDIKNIVLLNKERQNEGEQETRVKEESSTRNVHSGARKTKIRKRARKPEA